MINQSCCIEVELQFDITLVEQSRILEIMNNAEAICNEFSGDGDGCVFVATARGVGGKRSGIADEIQNRPNEYRPVASELDSVDESMQRELGGRALLQRVRVGAAAR